jgi:hypothetical protein
VILVSPRVYQAMARDGLFFASFARLHPRWRTPVAAIVAQGAWASALLLVGSYGQLLDYVTFADWIFFGSRRRRWSCCGGATRRPAGRTWATARRLPVERRGLRARRRVRGRRVGRQRPGERGARRAPAARRRAGVRVLAATRGGRRDPSGARRGAPAR